MFQGADEETNCKLFNELWKENTVANFGWKDTVLHYIGNIEGKSILDIGCGPGVYCRMLKEMGASHVVGVDISKFMIQIACNYENESPLGIEYKVANCVDMGKIGDFDIVLVNLIFIYVKNKSELNSFVQNIYSNLKKGGFMIGLNPDTSQKEWHASMRERVGQYLTDAQEIENGSSVKINIKVSNQSFTATIFLLEHKIYEELFSKAGFEDFSVNPRYVSQKTMQQFPPGYWDDYIQHSCVDLLLAKKR